MCLVAKTTYNGGFCNLDVKIDCLQLKRIMVVLIRCNDIVSDPRAMKYVKYLRQTRKDYLLIGWDREGNKGEQPYTIYYHKKAGFNVGGFKAVRDRIGWMWFVYKSLIKNASRKAVLHGCDVDSAFPAACYKLTHHSTKLIFDVFDWFSHTLVKQSAYIRRAFSFMERFTLSKSDHVIICEAERKEQVQFPIQDEVLSVLPNIPYFETENFLKSAPFNWANPSLLCFSYVGGLVCNRCLKELISIAQKGIINLAIAGYGRKELEDTLSSLKDCPNIRYFGKVKYEDGLNISYNSDIMYAMYSIETPNHVYAAPNKYYEAMFLGKPLLTTKGTIVERKVLSNKIGYVTGETENEIIDAIRRIDKEDAKEKGRVARQLWESKYCSFTKDFMEREYAKMIK